MATACEQIKNSHAHGDSVRHLIENQRPAAVSDFRRNLDTAIHRSRMHDNRVRLGAFEVSWLQTVMNCILAHRWKERGILSLALNAQDHHHVSLLDRILKVTLNTQAI